MASALPLALLALALLCGCPSAPHTILSDQPQPPGSYRYAAVGVDSPLSKKIESMVPRADIVSRHAHDGQLAYVVRDEARDQLFKEVPFKPLERATLTVRLSRVSDINGWGVEVNGEVHAEDQLERVFTVATMPDVIVLLQRLTGEPWATVKEMAPEMVHQVASREPVVMFERGFVLDLTVELVTGNPFDKETRVVLYGLAVRSGYYDASGGKGDALGG